MNARLREALRPIPDAALPTLKRQIASGARVISAALLATATLGNLASIATGAAEPTRGAAMALACCAGFGALHLVSRSRRGDERPDIVLFALALVTAVIIALAGFPGRDRVHPVPWASLTMPLTLAAFAPWRPTLSLALTPALGAIWLAGRWALGPDAVRVDPAMAMLVLAVSGGLAAAANQLQRRLWARLEETRAQLAAAERMYGLGQLTAGIAHELKTPVAATLNGLQSVASLCDELDASIGHDEVTPDDLREISRELREAATLSAAGAERAASVVAAVREHTRALHQTTRAPMHLAERVSAVVLLMSPRIRRSRVRLEVGPIDPGLEVEGDPGKFDQVLTNLLGNAFDACEESGVGTRVAVSVEARDGALRVAVDDDGPGVPEAIRERIFDPMFTTRAAANGSGLGLAISRDLARGAFHGELAYVPLPRGARFELRCPLRGAAPALRRSWQPASAA